VSTWHDCKAAAAAVDLGCSCVREEDCPMYMSRERLHASMREEGINPETYAGQLLGRVVQRMCAKGLEGRIPDSLLAAAALREEA